jgi:1-deoxy-D-xylulose-5-phosphate synthase
LGSDAVTIQLCIVSVGKMLDAAEAAAEQLEAQGISVSVWDARVVKPLDPAMIEDAARHPYVITIEDGLRQGGVGMSVADLVSEYTIGDTEPRVRVLGIPSQYIAHGKPDAILADLGLDAAGVTASALSMIRSDDTAPASS